MDIFVFIPAVALGCYLILLSGILSVKNTKLKQLFISTISVYILWVLGSVCMRLDIWPSYQFWFHVSLFGVFLIPCVTVLFCERYINGKNSFGVYALQVIATLWFLVNLLTGGWFVAPPEQVVTEVGVKFVYHIGIQSVLPYVTYCIIMIYLGVILIRGVRSEKIGRQEFVLIFTGKMVMLLGNILINIPPFTGFPIDMSTGILDALSMCLVFGGNQLVHQYRGTSKAAFRLFVMGATFTLMLCMERPYENLLKHTLNIRNSENTTFIIVVSYLVIFVLFFFLMDKMAEKLFIKDEEVQMERLNEFREASHRTLQTEELQTLICNTASRWMKLSYVAVCSWRPQSREYVMDKPLPDGSIPTLHRESPLIRFMTEKTRCTPWSEIPQECREGFSCLEDVKTLVVTAIQGEQEPYALVFARGVKRLSDSDKRYLELLSEISVDAIHNAELYSQVYWESRMDRLTGSGNRKHFFEVLEQVRAQEPNRPVTMLLLKPDHFRVCNQMYGVAGGDRILREIAGLMQKEACREDVVFRYSASEFLMLMCGYDLEQARESAERIRVGVMNIDGLFSQKQMMLSVSIGLCTVPEGERIDTQTLDRCTMALYRAQGNGGNCITAYNGMLPQQELLLENSLFEEYEPVFRALTAAIDAKDHYTFYHSQNVSYYAVELARAKGLAPEEVSVIREAGLLHDIGKIGIPEAILNKPGRLTPEEFKIMQSHVEQAKNILQYLSGMEYILPAILGHHERYDGTGYPRGMAGTDIPLLARILTIVDSFDAMVSVRPYKNQFPVHYALRELEEGKGTQFDPELVPLFLSLVENGTIRVRQEGKPQEPVR